jgi:hypothetical protein
VPKFLSWLGSFAFAFGRKKGKIIRFLPYFRKDMQSYGCFIDELRGNTGFSGEPPSAVMADSGGLHVLIFFSGTAQGRVGRILRAAWFNLFLVGGFIWGAWFFTTTGNFATYPSGVKYR